MGHLDFLVHAIGYSDRNELRGRYAGSRAQAVRVNSLSAGPVKTLAASGVGDFRHILQNCRDASPLRRAVTAEDIAESGLYLLSDLSSGVTGETHHVDCGFNIVGMKAVDGNEAAPSALAAGIIQIIP